MRSFIFFYIWRMNGRWYLCALVALSVLLGVYSHQTSAPNQEITLQFNKVEVSTDEAEKTIASIKEQLLELGVQNIRVHNTSENLLKITYYSDVNVHGVKQQLSIKNISHDLNLSSRHTRNKDSHVPVDENHLAYNLDVYEIIKTSNTDWNLEGTITPEIKTESNRLHVPDFYASRCQDNLPIILNEAISSTGINDASLVNNTSYVIPEVRAGPLFVGA